MSFDFTNVHVDPRLRVLLRRRLIAGRKSNNLEGGDALEGVEFLEIPFLPNQLFGFGNQIDLSAIYGEMSFGISDLNLITELLKLKSIN
jgi:hypothetical protein